MAASTVAIEISRSVYEILLTLAEAEQIDPAEMLEQIVECAVEQRERHRSWAELQAEIRREGSKFSGMSPDEIVDELRATRKELFNVNYAHLYR